MRICAVQTRPVKGNIEKNIETHKKLIELALSYQADMIIFPELSITGYEPELSKQLAFNKDDSRFDDFQKISDSTQVVIGIGVPTVSNLGICISMVLFKPHQQRQIYSKKYLHADEEAFFVSGQNDEIGLTVKKTNIALAICYEISVPEHSALAFENGAEVYTASVAKSKSGVEKAAETLSEIAKKYAMCVLMSNCAGQSGGFVSAGQSSAWTNKGTLAGHLDDVNEGVIIMDTDTGEVIKKVL